jgi:hypothetical protein
LRRRRAAKRAAGKAAEQQPRPNPQPTPIAGRSRAKGGLAALFDGQELASRRGEQGAAVKASLMCLWLKEPYFYP